MTRAIVMLLRPKQWLKNAFVLAPLIFSGKFADGAALLPSIQVVALFCLAASASYVLNDLHDIAEDAQHPQKAGRRPLTAGVLTARTAKYVLGALCLALAGALLLMPKAVAAIVLFYLLLNIAYTYWLKTVPVVDLFAIATGFVLRVYAGAEAISVPVSGWMFVTALCLALYIAAHKRRGELVYSGTGGRAVLARYPACWLDYAALLAAMGTLLFYGLFVVLVRPMLLMTLPLVVFGVFRYWYAVDARGAGESPADDLLADRELLAAVLLWLALTAWQLWPQ